MTDGKTRKLSGTASRRQARLPRGHIDSQTPVVGFQRQPSGDVRSEDEKITEWKERSGRVRNMRSSTKDVCLTAGMDNDFAVRLTTTPGITEYLLPHETNVRHVEVQNPEAFQLNGWETSTAARSSISSRWCRDSRRRCCRSSHDGPESTMAESVAICPCDMTDPRDPVARDAPFPSSPAAPGTTGPVDRVVARRFPCATTSRGDDRVSPTSRSRR